jgi:hypothetical protein
MLRWQPNSTLQKGQAGIAREPKMQDIFCLSSLERSASHYTSPLNFLLSSPFPSFKARISYSCKVYKLVTMV